MNIFLKNNLTNKTTMIKENIALFKRFLYGRGLETIFVGLYRADSKNEVGLDVYLLNVDSRDVLSKAFFIKNESAQSPFRTRAYWVEQQRLFDNEVQKASRDGWYCDHNAPTVDKWYRHPLGVEQYAHKAEKKAKEGVHDTLQEEHNEKDKMGMKGLAQFTFFDLSSKTRNPSSLAHDVVSVNTRNGCYKFSFDATHSEEILASGLKYMAVGKDEYTGQVRVVFNNEDGLTYPKSCVDSHRVVINSAALVNLLKSLFGRDEEFFLLRISKNIANSKKYLTYNIDNV